jgi:glycosyltransferase involved in cell wall biosynthesis
MIILFATPYSDHAGGINQWAKHIIDYHRSIDSDVELDILAMNDPKGSDRSKPHSILNRIWYGIRTYTAVVKTLKAKTKERHYDVLHIASSASISLLKDLWMMRIARRRGIKSILHLHFGRIPQLAERKGWEWRLLKRAIRMADRCIVLDKRSYTTLHNYGFSNVSLLANPLSPHVEEIIQRCGDVSRVKSRLLFVGHCIPTKGVYELAQAAKRVEEIELRIIGPIHNDIRGDLERMADNASWLDIKGQCNFESVIREMLECGIFVLPTYTEGFPNVIIESMACGCPIVTTPVGAIPEMLAIEGDKPCGKCVAPRDVDALTTAIKEFLAQPVMAQEYGLRAKQRIEREYSIENIWRELCLIWKF